MVKIPDLETWRELEGETVWAGGGSTATRLSLTFPCTVSLVLCAQLQASY